MVRITSDVTWDSHPPTGRTYIVLEAGVQTSYVNSSKIIITVLHVQHLIAMSELYWKSSSQHLYRMPEPQCMARTDHLSVARNCCWSKLFAEQSCFQSRKDSPQGMIYGIVLPENN